MRHQYEGDHRYRGQADDEGRGGDYEMTPRLRHEAIIESLGYRLMTVRVRRRSSPSLGIHPPRGWGKFCRR